MLCAVFFACIFPLQGLFNALVYFRPKYNTIRNRDELSSVQALARVLDIQMTVSSTIRSRLSDIAAVTLTSGRTSPASPDIAVSAQNETKASENDIKIDIAT